MKRFISLFMLAFLLCGSLQAQTVLQGTNANTCSGDFYDTGGPGGNYQVNENNTSTICPNVAGASTQLNFVNFSVENGWDAMYVYNGPNTGSPLFNSGQGGTNGGFPAGGYTGTTAQGLIFTSTDPSGCLTVHFQSDASITSTGWDATISCLTPCSGTPTAGTTVSDNDYICITQTANLSLSGASTGITYQWQSSPDNITFTDISGATAATYAVTGLVANTYFRCVVTCTASGLTDNSISVLVHFSSVCYCTTPVYSVGPSCTYGIDITNVTFAGINNNSACNGTAPYYTFYSSIVGSAVQGSIQSISIDDQPVPFYDTYMMMWIDYNDNGSFEDPGEQIYVSGNLGWGGGSGVAPVTGSYTIPGGAPVGMHRLRVRCSDVVTNSCTDDGYAGEVEDYMINITAPPPCSGTPDAGNTLSDNVNVCSGATFNLSLDVPTGGAGITLQWQSSPDNVTWTDIAGATSATYATSETVSTYFRCNVTCTTSGLNAFSNPILVNLNCQINIGSVALVNTCSGTFFDNGGPSSNYPNFSNVETTICPSVAGNATQLTFTSFSTESGWDPMYVYNGPSNASPLFNSGNGGSNGGFPAGGWWGSTLPGTGGVFTSTDPSGCLTVHFNSDASFNYTGWAATISCLAPCSGTPTAGTTVGDNDYVCTAQTVNLSLTGTTIAPGLTYQWQSSPDGITWTDIGGATSATYAASGLTADTYFRCVVTCSASGLSDNSSGLLVHYSVVCYCNTPVYSVGPSCNYGIDITNVTFAGINNTSACNPTAPYFTFYSAIQGSAMQGTTQSISIDDQPDPFYDTYFMMWIDYNDNGSFEDPGEQIFVSNNIGFGGGTGTVPATGSYTIPLTAPAGVHRMRVRCSDVVTNSCTDDGYAGEVEDYMINIIAAPVCSGTPTAGTAVSDNDYICNTQTANLSLTGGSVALGLTYQWQSSPDNITFTDIPGATAATYAATGLTADTYFRCVVTCSASTLFDNSVSVLVHFSAACYCTAPVYTFAAGCPYGIYITNVNFAGINNTTGCNSTAPYYTFYPGIVGSALQGSIQPISIDDNYAPFYDTYMFVWIDYNDNGSFEDPGEQIFASGNIGWGGGSGIVPATGTYTIPGGAPVGTHRLRVRCADVTVNSCTDDGVAGEVEDYMITITAPPPCSGTPDAGNTIADNSNVCSGATFNLGLDVPTGAPGLTFQWQSSPDNATWTDIAGATAGTYATSETVSTYFRCNVTCTNSGLNAFSNSILINLNCQINIGSVALVNTCSGSFFDNGGPSSNYPNFSNAETTICPDVAGNFSRLTFTSFNTESGWDPMYVYNGPTNASPLFNSGNGGSFGGFPAGGWWGSTLPGTAGVFTSTDASGCLTVHFNSDASFNYSGWAATISCVAPCAGTPTPGTAIASPASSCPSGSSTISLSGNSTDPGITYQWQSSATAGGPYTNIPGATSSTYVTGSLAATTYFVCVVSCTNSGQSATSSEASVTIAATPTGDVISNPILIPSLPYNTTGSNANCFTSTYTGGSAQPSPDVFYQLTTTCEDQLSIVMCGSGFDTYIHLLDGSGNTLASNDDFCGLQSEILNFPVSHNSNYYVVVEGYSGSTGNYTMSITGTYLTPPSVTCPSNIAVCADAGTNHATVSWATPVASTPCTGSVNVVSNPASGSVFTVGTHTVNVTATDIHGNVGTCSFTVTVNGNPTPSASSNSPVCDNGTLNLGSSPNGMSSYAWSGPGGFSAGIQAPTVTPASTYGAGSYTVTVTDGNGCIGSASTNVTLNTAPTATVSGGGNVCPGGVANVPITVTFNGGGSHTFTYLANGANPVTVSTNANPYTFNVSPSVTTTYTVSTVSNATCSNTGNGSSATVTFNATPVAGTASSDAVVCSGSNYSATLSGSNGATIDWQYTSTPAVPASWVTTGLPNATSMSYPVSSNTYFRAVVTSPGCPNMVSNTILATMAATPAVTLSNVTDVSMVATWTPDQTAGATFNLTVSGGGSGTGTFNGVTSPYTITGLSSGASYTVSVTLIPAQGVCSPAAGTASATTTCSASVVTPTPVNNTHESISWSNAGTGDSLIYHSVITANWTRVHPTTNPATIAVTAGTTYAIYVKKQCVGGGWINSPVVYFITNGSVCPTVPVVNPVSSDCPTLATLTWGAVPGAVSYKVTIMRTAPTSQVLSYTVTGTSYTFATTGGYSYSCFVRAMCSATTYSPASQPVSYVAPALAGYPDNVVVSNPTCNGFSVSWSTVPGASSYAVKFKKVGANTTFVYTTTGNIMTVTTLATNTSWLVSVATTENCTGSATYTQSAYGPTVPGSTLSCKDPEVEAVADAFSDIKVYPNPNSGAFSISYTNGTDQTVTYMVTNVLGQQVYSEMQQEASGLVNHQIDLGANSASGIYYITIKTGNTVITKQVMVAH